MSLPGGSVSAGMSVQMAQSSLDKDFDFPQMVFDLIASIESGKETKEDVVKKVCVYWCVCFVDFREPEMFFQRGNRNLCKQSKPAKKS